MDDEDLSTSGQQAQQIVETVVGLLSCPSSALEVARLAKKIHPLAHTQSNESCPPSAPSSSGVSCSRATLLHQHPTLNYSAFNSDKSERFTLPSPMSSCDDSVNSFRSETTTSNRVEDQSERRESHPAPSIGTVLIQLRAASQCSDVSGLLKTAFLTAVDGLQHDNEVAANELLELISTLSNLADTYLRAMSPYAVVNSNRKVRFSCLSPPKDGDAASWVTLARTAQAMHSFLLLSLELMALQSAIERFVMCSTSKEYRDRLIQNLRINGRCQNFSVDVIYSLQSFLSCFSNGSRDGRMPSLSFQNFRRNLGDTLDSLTRALLRRLFDEPPIPRKDHHLSIAKRPSLCNLLLVTEFRIKARKRPLSADFPAIDAMTPSSLFAQALKQLSGLYYLYSDLRWLCDDSYDAMINSLPGYLTHTISEGSASDRFIAAKVLIGACHARDFIRKTLKATYQVESKRLVPTCTVFWEDECSLADPYDVWHCIEHLYQQTLR